MRHTILLALLLLSLGQYAGAAVFHDSVSNLQRMLEFVIREGQEVKKYAEMVKTAQQAVKLVEGTITMVEQGAKQLSSMPKGMNMLDWITQTYGQAEAIMGRVAWVGFQLDKSTTQFDALYRNTALLTTPQGRAERIRQMREARMEMLGIAVQTQSIKESFGNIFARLGALLGASSWAEGTRALQQIQLQQRALAQQQAQLGTTIQAVSARLDAMKQAEELLLQTLTEDAARDNATLWYASRPMLLPPGFNGFMIAPQGGR